ncbi:MAG TPA: hypothetical protein VGM56_30995 [Byssovorax sp.]
MWKALGAAVILAPRLPRLKEWAYAGIVWRGGVARGEREHDRERRRPARVHAGRARVVVAAPGRSRPRPVDPGEAGLSDIRLA